MRSSSTLTITEGGIHQFIIWYMNSLIATLVKILSLSKKAPIAMVARHPFVVLNVADGNAVYVTCTSVSAALISRLVARPATMSAT